MGGPNLTYKREMKFVYGFLATGLAQQCTPTHQATCDLHNGATGLVTLTQCSEGHVQITGDISCTASECEVDGNHGFHVHESAPTQNDDQTFDCAAAGGHFRKDGQVHAALDAPERHWGAIGNIMIAGKKHSLNINDSKNTLDSTQPNYIGEKGMVLHAGEDNFKPEWGNAGSRVACCAISKVTEITPDGSGNSAGILSALTLTFLMLFV